MPRRIPHDPEQLLPAGSRWLRESRYIDKDEMRRRNARYVNHAAGDTYNTPLSRDEEAKFKRWLEYHNIGGFSIDDDRPAYNLRAFWKALQNGDPDAIDAWDPESGNGREFPPRFRTVYHPEFDSRSMYALPESDIPVGRGPNDIPSISIILGLRPERRGG